jgi:hypothetical protein
VRRGEEIHPEIHRDGRFTRTLENSIIGKDKEAETALITNRNVEAYPMTERWGDRRTKEENRVVIEVSPWGGKDQGLEINAFTKDISPSGARILTDQLFPLNSTLHLTFYLSRSRQVVRTPGTVKWGKRQDDSLYEIGVQFHHGIPGVLMAMINHLYGKEEAIPTEVLKGQPR